MILAVQRDSDEPVYGQIARQIREHIATGRLPTGATLPSVRALASDLGVNQNTVARAFRLLEAEGFLAIRDRSGSQVLSPSTGGRDYRRQLRTELRELLARMHQAGITPSMLETLFGDELARLKKRS